MRPEEQQLLTSRLIWFALAIFLVFFAYGELHELEKTVRAQELASTSNSAPLIGLKEDRDRALANQKIYDKIKVDYKELSKQIPSLTDIHHVIRSLEKIGQEATISFEEISFSERPVKKGESFAKQLLNVRLKASYKEIRHFLALVETAVEKKKLGLQYLVDRVEMTPSGKGLLATVVLKVKMKPRGM